VLPVAVSEKHNHVARVPNVADEPVVSDPVSPETFLFSMQSLPERAGILGLLHTLSQVANDVALCFPVEFGEGS
jgi:hypothetical protein